MAFHNEGVSSERNKNSQLPSCRKCNHRRRENVFVVSKTVREINYHATVFIQIGIDLGYGFPLRILWKRENTPLTLIV